MANATGYFYGIFNITQDLDIDGGNVVDNIISGTSLYISVYDEIYFVVFAYNEDGESEQASTTVTAQIPN